MRIPGYLKEQLAKVPAGTAKTACIIPKGQRALERKFRETRPFTKRAKMEGVPVPQEELDAKSALTKPVRDWLDARGIGYEDGYEVFGWVFTRLTPEQVRKLAKEPYVGDISFYADRE